QFFSIANTIHETIHHFLTTTNTISKLHTNLCKLQTSMSKSNICHQSSLYFISSEMKSWTESRRYCRERGADLIIINNTEEQVSVCVCVCDRDVYSDLFWIGLTDIEVEGRWKWVDVSYHTESNSYQGKEEDCAINYSPGWADYPCNYILKWICEKNIFK
uniref:C-type lectin domain-containing protein n=1 Tax=Cyprinus carpio TaxID=7962 RepID=A0A8C1XZ21_CYPCA